MINVFRNSTSLPGPDGGKKVVLCLSDCYILSWRGGQMLQDRREGGGVVGDPKITFLSAPLSQ